jgi:hypothetical protein
MNAADLARLELAKRAYKAAEPSDAEVQTGVRRARLWLGRPKPRRAWFSKGLVLVVLAVGSLAYAKPQVAGDLVEKALGRDGAGGKRLKSGIAVEAPVAALVQGRATKHLGRALVPSIGEAERATEATDARAVVAAQDAAPTAAPQAAASTRAAVASPQAASPQAAAMRASLSPARPTALATAEPATTAEHAPPSGAVTDWGRVGQALARGDSAEALSALGELSESDDPSTRDKADLGRAQLLMAHGQPEKACTLARSLTHRRAGGRIERQAQLLLKGCGR